MCVSTTSIYSSRGGSRPKKVYKKKNTVVIRTRNASRAFIIVDDDMLRTPLPHHPLAQTKGGWWDPPGQFAFGCDSSQVRPLKNMTKLLTNCYILSESPDQ